MNGEEALKRAILKAQSRLCLVMMNQAQESINKAINIGPKDPQLTNTLGKLQKLSTQARLKLTLLIGE